MQQSWWRLDTIMDTTMDPTQLGVEVDTIMNTIMHPIQRDAEV
jgi:hypothetical protein